MNSPRNKTRSRQGGAAMIEFILIFPLLIILCFGIVELGRALYQKNMLTKSLTTGTRFIARIPDAVETNCAQGPNWGQATTLARQLISYSSDGELLLPGLDAPGAMTFSTRTENFGGISNCIVRTEASLVFDGIFGDRLVPLLNIGQVNLGAAAEERYIGD